MVNIPWGEIAVRDLEGEKRAISRRFLAVFFRVADNGLSEKGISRTLYFSVIYYRLFRIPAISNY